MSHFHVRPHPIQARYRSLPQEYEQGELFFCCDFVCADKQVA